MARRWAACDEYAEKHLIPTTTPLGKALDFAVKLSAQEGLPKYEVSPLQGSFLALQCKLARARNILELGTLGGYSSIWMASSHAAARVTTIEMSAHNRTVAGRAIAHAGLADRVEIRAGRGLDVLPQLQREIDAGARDKFGFVFIDADKRNSRNYLQLAIPMCSPGACIIIDNVVREGELASAAAAEVDEHVHGSRQAVEAAGADPRLECTLTQTVGGKGYDGFLMCLVK